ncbi:TPA: hypothetical protein NKO30_006724 [Pseudomonas aeruginosa]|nr:hypothetical protein [Pseudomonas aeruginosa]
MKPLVVISFYDRRSPARLEALLDSLDSFQTGVDHERVICVNATGGPSLPEGVRRRVHGVFERPNAGMNIGAWDAAWRHWPGRPAYLFLQDECFAVREGWMELVLQALQVPGVGLVGESLNPAWDRPWDALREGPGKSELPEHFIDGRPDNRVDVYLHHMRRYGIDPGDGGRHLRSLVWALRGQVLEAIGGFPQGANYGECIAAEIGVSRAVIARGLTLQTLGPAPFHAFRHFEWSQEKPGGPFTQKSLGQELSRLRQENSELRARLNAPTLSDLWRALTKRGRDNGAES